MIPQIICVVGPTATGKRKWAWRWPTASAARWCPWTLCRSIGAWPSAPPPPLGGDGGHPHHMVGVADPAESWSVARFVSEADVCVQDILRRGRRPILVGGTGLYLESLIRGTDFAAGSAGGVTRQRLQQRLEQEGVGPLLAELQTIDPDSAARLHPGDEKRILRALEVWYETGETITQHDHRTRQQPPRYRAAYIGLSFQDRAQLRRRIDLRVDEMVRQGLLEEVQALLAAGLPPTATAWQAIGYKQFLAAADGRCTVTEAIEEVKLRSRQYAKRQLTWLRRNPDIHWILWGEEPNFPQGPAKCDRISHRSWLTISPVADGTSSANREKEQTICRRTTTFRKFSSLRPASRAFP